MAKEECRQPNNKIFDSGVRTCTLFFFYFRFATHESTDIEWVRYGFPVPDRDRAGPSSAFLWGHVNSTRALLQTPLVLLREEDSFELGVIAMTIHHGGQPLGKSTFGAWLNCKRQRSSERHELTHHNSSLSEGARGWSSTL